MDKVDIKKKFDEVQEILDSMSGEGATFMFIGDEGNHFTISGYPMDIMAQIIFAMIRYPVVEKIIKGCAAGYEEMKDKFGDDLRNVRMTRLIEMPANSQES